MFTPRRHASPRLFFAPSTDAAWPADDSDDDQSEPDEIDEEHWDAFLPDDDYDPHPAPGDFYPDQEAA